MSANVDAGGVGAFLELRKRLQTGLLIVGKDVAGSPAKVSVTGGDSFLHISTPRGLLRLDLPAGVSHEQGSCIQTAGGESGHDELHFRLRISVDQCTDEETLEDVIEGLQPKKSYCFYCQVCNTRLLQDRVFKRVLPLPNGNWNAIVDDWCCHPDPFANKKLLPRVEDCLLGDTFLLVARDSSCEETLTEEEGPLGTEDSQDPKKPCRRAVLISCKSCLSVLGEALAPATLKLYITEIVVEPSVGDRRVVDSLNRFLFLERTIAARLLELSSSRSNFHFVIQTPDEKNFLLLWLLNTDSIIASAPEKSVSGDRPVSPSLHNPSHRAIRALKLLYIACSDRGAMQRETINSWEVNVIGHLLVFPLKVCEMLLQQLDNSNSSLPRSLRFMTSFKVSYLRLLNEGSEARSPDSSATEEI
ncbi:E3 ubiquitin-protein ligase E3D [Lampris incognitus]|uniref:E3 ubiquitin-protein ligase E3D n=1 Tax=Lampris incognitus TaxID=2546036 RepID=UPI0024B51905|nr:E3 ubiquitin-protein ligase E3D [Lampris incognitus]